MTTIKFFKKNNKIVAVDCSGHTGYDEVGRDIVCATISTAIQTCIHGMIMVVGIKDFYLKRDEEKGELIFKLPTNLAKNQIEKCNLLFDTMYETIKDIQDGYSKYLLMEVIEDVY